MSWISNLDPKFVKWIEETENVIIECESPQEIVDNNSGSRATGWMAEEVLHSLLEDYKLEQEK